MTRHRRPQVLKATLEGNSPFQSPSMSTYCVAPGHDKQVTKPTPTQSATSQKCQKPQLVECLLLPLSLKLTFSKVCRLCGLNKPAVDVKKHDRPRNQTQIMQREFLFLCRQHYPSLLTLTSIFELGGCGLVARLHLACLGSAPMLHLLIYF